MLALLASFQFGKAQIELPSAPPIDRTAPGNESDLAQQHLVRDVSRAVIRLEADVDRTQDAIENSQITLTLDTMPDPTLLHVLCDSGGKPLGAFVQSLTAELDLEGKVNEVACNGIGSDDNPFLIKFRLHYESGQIRLFEEWPPEIAFVIAKPMDDDQEGDSSVSDEEDYESGTRPVPIQRRPTPKPAILNPRHSQTSHVVVQLPQGWTPIKLPEPVHANSAFGTIDSVATFADGTLTVDRKLAIKQDKVEVAELDAFQKWSEFAGGHTSVPLRSTLYYPNRDASAGTEEQKKAAGLIDEAYNDIQAKKYDEAEAALKEAEAVDRDHEILHENRGELAAARGDYVTALKEYRKELEAFPNALFEMGSIAAAQRALGDMDGSIMTLQRWILADPNSSLGVVDLMRQYHAMGRDDLAVRTGDDAMITMTKDAKRSVDFLLTYGEEQTRTGLSRGASSTLEALLDLTVNTEMVNDAAYLLSEQGLSLDRAEQSVREALKEFEPDNPMRGISAADMQGNQDRASLLLAAWDTLGWILYKKGSLREAESYVQAAWHGKQDIAISRHLGEILTAEQKPVDAMNVYTLGLATITDMNTAETAKNPDAIAIRAAMQQLKEEGNKPTVADLKAELLALRTVNLGPAAKPRNAAPCTVTLTSSALTSFTYKRDAVDDAIVVTDSKLLAGFFPSGSHASLIREATIQCSKTCSVVFEP